MENYQDVDYLKSLLDNPSEFKKQSILSRGEIIQEMFANNIIPPLSLISSEEGITSIGIAMANVYSNKYTTNDFKKFISKVKKGYNLIPPKTAKNFIKEVEPTLSQYMDIKNIESIVKISTVKEAFVYFNELQNILNKRRENNDISTLEREQLLIKSFKELSVADLNDIEDSNAMILLQENTENISSFILNNLDYYSMSNIDNLIYSIIKNQDLINIPDSIKLIVPISLMLRNIEKNEENIQFIREALDIQVNESENFLRSSLLEQDIDKLSLLELDSTNENDKKIALALIKYASYRLYSHKDFRSFILNSPIAKLITIDELNNTFLKSNKLSYEFNGETIWGDESINSIVNVANLKKDKYYTIDDLYRYFSDGYSYKNSIIENIKIPVQFLEKIDKEITTKGGYFLINTGYRRDNSIYESRENFQRQVLQYIVSKKIKEIRENKNLSTDDINNYLDNLAFLSTNFNSLTTKDTVIQHSNHDNERAKILIDTIRLENDIYDFSKEVFKISQNNFKYSDINNFKKMYRNGNLELSAAMLSALVQEIKTPNLLWVLPNLKNDLNSYSYSNKNVHLLNSEGLSYEESLKSILEFPLIDKKIILEEILETKDSYKSKRDQIVINGFNLTSVYKTIVLNLIDRNRFPEMSDSDFNVHLQSVEDFVEKNVSQFEDKGLDVLKKIKKNKKESLLKKITKRNNLSNEYIFSLEYLFNNFSLDLLYQHIKYDEKTLKKLYDLKGNLINKEIVASIIKEVFDIYYVKNKYARKDMPTENLLNSSEDFIFNLVCNNPTNFEDLKTYIMTGPHGQRYKSIFFADKINIIEELVICTDIDKIEELYSLSVFTDIKKNIGNFLSSKNMVLINFLLEKLPSNKFHLLFNECTYAQQRVILKEDNIIITALNRNSNDVFLSFNPSTFEEFVEVFDFLRLRKRLDLVKCNKDNSNSYYDEKCLWECSKVLKNINIPNLDKVINYLIEELPLSFVNNYELRDLSAYAGKLPRTLNVEEFIKLINNINTVSPGLMYIGHESNDKNEILDSVLESTNNRKENHLYILNKNLDVYLKILDRLKSSPKDYAQIVALNNNFVYQALSSLIDYKHVEPSNYNSVKLYSWKKIPKDCLILNEIKSVFESKYSLIELFNSRSYAESSNDEYNHKFFNIFIDKKIYIEGLKNITEDALLKEGVSTESLNFFYSKYLQSYTYNIRKNYKEDINYADYSKLELENLTNNIINSNPGFFFNRYLPKTTILRNEEYFLSLENSPKNIVEDEFFEQIKKNAFLSLIDENLTANNVWSVLLSTNSIDSYSRIKEDDKIFILNEILNMPDIDLNILKKIQVLVELTIELNKGNNMENLSNNSIFSCLSSSELNDYKIIVDNMIMEKEINAPSLNSKKVNKF